MIIMSLCAGKSRTCALCVSSCASTARRGASVGQNGLMSDVDRTDLPGIGVRSEFRCVGGTRIGVLLHNDGRRDVLVYGDADPDAPVASLALGEGDARTLAELLGSAHVEQHGPSALNLAGLAIDWIEVGETSSIAGSTIGEAQIRDRTGASIVAMVRADAEPILAPGPDVQITAGDTIVAVGDESGVQRLRTVASGR